jgi:hypothetical protein
MTMDKGSLISLLARLTCVSRAKIISKYADDLNKFKMKHPSPPSGCIKLLIGQRLVKPANQLGSKIFLVSKAGSVTKGLLTGITWGKAVLISSDCGRPLLN